MIYLPCSVRLRSPWKYMLNWYPFERVPRTNSVRVFSSRCVLIIVISFRRYFLRERKYSCDGFKTNQNGTKRMGLNLSNWVWWMDEMNGWNVKSDTGYLFFIFISFDISFTDTRNLLRIFKIFRELRRVSYIFCWEFSTIQFQHSDFSQEGPVEAWPEHMQGFFDSVPMASGQIWIDLTINSCMPSSRMYNKTTHATGLYRLPERIRLQNQSVGEKLTVSRWLIWFVYKK